MLMPDQSRHLCAAMAYKRPQPKQGLLVVLTGPMTAGKSTELIKAGKQYSKPGGSVVYCRPSADTRSDVDSLTTHDNVKVAALVIGPDKLRVAELAKYDVICIDEIQFMSASSVCRLWFELVELRNRIVIMSGLDMDFLDERWPATDTAIALSDSHHMLAARCRCGKPATHTARLNSTVKTKVAIGGASDYQAMCANCKYLFMSHLH
jgi:thymidine kinase